MLIAEAGLAIPLVAVSSVLRERALSTSSQEVNAESGFPALVGYLENTVKAQAGMLARRSASEAILAVTEQVSLGLRAKLSTQDPTSLAGLEDAQRAAELLRRQSARSSAGPRPRAAGASEAGTACRSERALVWHGVPPRRR